MASRIQKSIKNAKVNVIFYVITAVLAFFSRKVFLDNLGTEFLGLSSTLGDILNLMNITELGIGTAVGVTLYKPLFNDEREKISDIVSVYGFLYSRIGILIGSASFILSCFFPLMFKDINIPLWLVYFMFFSMVYGALLSYFVNYKQIILSASQNNYVIMYRYNTIIIIKTLLQMSSSFLPYCYVWWILMELVAGTVNSFILHLSVKKRYPWLDTSVKLGKEKFKEYQELWVKTKQVFVLKISHLVFNGSINLFIGFFVSFPMVAMYGNYNMVMAKITGFVDGVFSGMEASVGNLIAEGNKQRTLHMFFELLSIRYFLAGVCSITLYLIVPKFIAIWLGEQYVLESHVLVLMSLHIFFQQARLTVDNFKNGYGLYSDVWAPIAEVVICIGLCLILGQWWGLSGILFSFVTAEFIIKMFWKPYFLFSRGFKESVFKLYWPVVIRYIAIIALTLFVNIISSNKIALWYGTSSLVEFLVYSVFVAVSTLLMMLVLFGLCDCYFRSFLQHIIKFKYKV